MIKAYNEKFSLNVFARDWDVIVDEFAASGDFVESRLGPTKELIAAQFKISPYAFPYRPGIARKLGSTELLQVLSGYFDERHLRAAAPGLRYGYGLTHAYGIKIAQQLERAVDQLRTNPATRRCIIHVGKPEDGAEVEKPCVQQFQFIGRGTELNLVATVRSWDLVSGFPYDVTVMGGLLQAVAAMTGFFPGFIYATAGSAHVYTDVWDGLKSKYPDKFKRITSSRGPTTLGKRPKNNYYALAQMSTLQEYREWAMDELNYMSEWENSAPIGWHWFSRSELAEQFLIKGKSEPSRVDPLEHEDDDYTEV